MKTHLRLPIFTFLLALFSLAFTADGWGQVSITVGSTIYSDEFTGFDGTTDPVNWFTSDVANTSIWQGTNAGTSTTGGKYSYGDIGSGATFEGSLGFLPSSTRAINADISFVNNTGQEIIGFEIAYVAEHWRSANGGNNNGWSVSYSINGGAFVNLTSLTYVAPNTNPTGVNPGGGPWSANSLSQNVLAVSIPVGQVITFRFFGNNGTAGGTRQGVAIDDFFVNFTIGGGGGSPVLAVNPSTISGLDYIVGSGPSASQSFDVSGLNLDPAAGNISVTAPTNFEVSTDDITFSSAVNLPYSGGELTATPVYVRLQSGLAINTYSDDVTISGGNATSVTVAVSGEVSPVPVPELTANPTSLSGLNYMEGNGPSSVQTFVLSGDNLDGTNVNISVPAQFEISTDNGTYSGAVMLAAYDGSNTTIYVRLAAGQLENTYNANADITGGGATAIAVSLEGSVIEPFELPYFNGLRNQADWDEATAYDFEFNNTSFSTGAGGYVKIPLNASIVSAPIDLSAYDLLVVSFDIASFGAGSGRELTVSVSDNNGATYTDLDSFPADQGASPYITFTQYIDVSGLSGTDGRIKFEMTDGGGSIRFRDLDMDFYEGYFYMDAAWFPGNPNGLNIPAEDLLVVNGETSLTSNTTFNSLTVADGAVLNVEAAITANGDITNNGSLVFVSNATTTGQLDTFAGAVSGDVTVQRYIPARRAFRLLSSAVTTSGSIRDNWQEGVNNPDTSTNHDPHPGFGTHITGSMSGENGFDATASGNPSLFTLNNATQSWVAVTNTDVNTITAGTPYRLLVRGDRSIDLNSNTAEPSNTVLRTTGILHTGTFTTTDFNENEGGSNFFGNPYPAAVNMNAVMTVSENINDEHYFVWDPNMGIRGAYVTVELPDGTSPGGSEANQYLQPGQAAFVITLENGPASLTFQESHKLVSQPLTQVFDVVSKIDLRLYTATAFAQGEMAADAVRIKFSETGSNAVTPSDATKFFNLDENLATNNGGSILSIESRALPQEGESIQLFNSQYRTTAYVFEARLSEVNDITTLLIDHYTNTTTTLENNTNTLYAFEVDATIPESIATDRFEIVFEELLSTGNVSFGNGFVLFPNPAQGEINIATKGISGEDVQLSITGVLGQNVYNKTHKVNSNGLLSIDTTTFANGVYILKLTGADGGQFTTKFIKK